MMFRSTMLAMAIALAASSPSIAAGITFTREVASGYSKGVFTYRNWDRQCQEIGGVTRVVTRPRHGMLTNLRVVSAVRSNRLNPRDPCIGRSIGGLQVIYRSNPGYRGTDRFVIERTRPNGTSDTDTFIMMVR